MTEKEKRLVFPAEILLPDVDVPSAFACIACDQFTSEKRYWEELKDFVGEKPSALNLILPEAYLSDDAEKRIKDIRRFMTEYVSGGVFKKLPKGYVLTVRKTPFVKRRIGLVAAIDLECYDYKKGSVSPIRATEGTIEERIPPRLKVRENADLELPHVMVLFDDEKREITEKLYENRAKYEKLYDFTLNMGGGGIEGYFIPEGDETAAKFYGLGDKERLREKYGDVPPLVLAVGDGNHSLATAKAFWEKIKSGIPASERETHPARFALCELVNVYDEGIYFEPIYRFVSGVDKEKFKKELEKIDAGNCEYFDGEKTVKLCGSADFSSGIRNTDALITDYIGQFGGAVDYIHGKENLFALVKSDKTAIGIMPETLKKEELFKIVANKGALPRKSFSMGEGVEKRYYLEAKLIK